MVVAGEQPYAGPASGWSQDWPSIYYLTKGWPITRRGRRWHRTLTFPVLLWRCLRLARIYRFKRLLVVFPNEEFLLAGFLVAIWTGAKLYPYFHNTYVENRKGLSLHFARWLQGRVFSKAIRVFVWNEGLAELYRQRYPGLKCSVLVGAVNEPIPGFSPPPEPRSPLQLIISGNIWDVCLDATQRVCDAVSQVRDSSLTFLTGMPRVFLEGMGLLKNGTRHESVPNEAVLSRLKEADILILPHGFTGSLSVEEYRTIFPTRTIEYLFSGRPILAHAPPDCYITRFLKEHRCALVVDEPNVSALIEAIDRLRSNAKLRSELVANAICAAAKFHAPRVAATLRAELQSD